VLQPEVCSLEVSLDPIQQQHTTTAAAAAALGAYGACCGASPTAPSGGVSSPPARRGGRTCTQTRWRILSLCPQRRRACSGGPGAVLSQCSAIRHLAAALGLAFELTRWGCPHGLAQEGTTAHAVLW